MSSSIDENVNTLWQHARTLKSCHDLQRFLTNLPDTKIGEDMKKLVENIINDPTWNTMLLINQSANQNHNGKYEIISTSSDSNGDNDVLIEEGPDFSDYLGPVPEERCLLRRSNIKIQRA